MAFGVIKMLFEVVGSLSYLPLTPMSHSHFLDAHEAALLGHKPQSCNSWSFGPCFPTPDCLRPISAGGLVIRCPHIPGFFADWPLIARINCTRFSTTLQVQYGLHVVIFSTPNEFFLQ